MTQVPPRYDALLLVSFGGPERREDVVPFLENVLRGKQVPRQRMLEVAEHYFHFGGVSPINQHNRDLIAALEPALAQRGIHLPIYWGNRNWHPLLRDTLRRMAAEGVRRALALVTSAFSSYSSCRQYLDDLSRASADLGPQAPQIDKIRPFFNHPGFVEAAIDRVRTALETLPNADRAAARLVFTAHSIPVSMARGCDYQAQLEDIASLIAAAVDKAGRWSLVYQSRSGPPSQPWLEPDVGDLLRELHARGDLHPIVLVPLGFLSDHMEVLYDLDVEAAALCDRLGIPMVRAATVGCHPRFIEACCDLVQERLDGPGPRAAVGRFPARADVCPADCCRWSRETTGAGGAGRS